MMADKPYNAADPKHVRSRKNREDKEQLRDEDAFNYVMADARGRNFIWWLLGVCGVFEDGMTGNSFTFHNLGRRSVGLQMISELEDITPEKFVQMWSEHLADRMRVTEEDTANRTETKLNGDNAQHIKEEEY